MVRLLPGTKVHTDYPVSHGGDEMVMWNGLVTRVDSVKETASVQFEDSIEDDNVPWERIKLGVFV